VSDLEFSSKASGPSSRITLRSSSEEDHTATPSVRIPHDDGRCGQVLREYGSFCRKQKREIVDMIQERTADEDMQEKIYEGLTTLLLREDLGSVDKR